MLTTILITAYCTFTYVVGYKRFNVKLGNTRFNNLVLWVLSPISIPITWF